MVKTIPNLNDTVFSWYKREIISVSEEKEKIEKLKQQVKYLFTRYSTINVSNVRVADGLINPNEYLKSLLKILASKADDTSFGKLLDNFVKDVNQLEKYLLVERKLFRYGLKKPPLMLGGVPSGFIVESVREHSKFPYGTIDYPQALSEQQVNDYELIPLFNDKAVINWCKGEIDKALEINIDLPSDEINHQQAIDLVRKMRLATSKVHVTLQKHWQAMINRVVSVFGTDFESLL